MAVSTIDLKRGPGIAVVGAGPVGLMVARLLQRQSFLVRVYERDAALDSRLQGGSLDIAEATGQRAIRAAGLWEAFAAKARASGQAFKRLTPDGTVIVDRRAEDGDARPEIDRTDLRRMLAGALDNDTICWGLPLTHLVRSDDTGWALQFADGHEARAALVLGCDGVNSVVRPLVAAPAPTIGVTTVDLDLGEVAAPALSGLVADGSLFAADGWRYLW